MSLFANGVPSLRNNDLTTREICGLCHRVVAVGFHVPNHVWEAVVHHSRLQDIHCLSCFIERADEKAIFWDRDIEFYPVSLATHLDGSYAPPWSLSDHIRQAGVR